MRHRYAGRKLGRTASHRRALLTNMATSLFEHKRLTTTVEKAKELRSFAEHLITRARNAYNAEKAGTIVGVDVHARRMVGRFIRNKAVLQELFDTIAPLVAARNGGYTRITKIGVRRGDHAAEAVIELVDWSNPQDGRSSSAARKRTAAKKTAKPGVAGAKPGVAGAKTATSKATKAKATSATAATAEVATAEAATAKPAAAKKATKKTTTKTDTADDTAAPESPEA